MKHTASDRGLLVRCHSTFTIWRCWSIQGHTGFHFCFMEGGHEADFPMVWVVGQEVNHGER